MMCVYLYTISYCMMHDFLELILSDQTAELPCLQWTRGYYSHLALNSRMY